MSIVGAVVERREVPAYVRFERRAIEDRAASLREGKYIARDIDYALVTPPYSKDVFEAIATEWLSQMQRDATAGRLPQEWYERYMDAYDRWKRGEELPLHGTPIKGWSVISPAQMKNLVALNIMTVEDLAAANDEGLRRIGMGAGELRDKAKAWLSQSADKGPLTMENAALKAENRALKTENEQLNARVKELAERLEILQRGGFDRYQAPPLQTPAQSAEAISAKDIIETPEPQQAVPQKRGPGRPRKNADAI